MNILITGATGFIGQHLIEDIKPLGYNVSIMTRGLSEKMLSNKMGCKIVVADLTDLDSLNSAFKGIDVVINTAAEVRNDRQLEKTNVLGSSNLINAAVNNSVKKIIHLSSVGVVGMQYQNSPVSVDEETAPFPKNGYEKTKYESERILLRGCEKHGIELNILRPTNVFGEKHPFNAILKLINHVNRSKITVLTKNAIVNYVYVKDLTGVMVELVSKKAPIIMNVGNETKLGDFIALLGAQLKVKPKLIFIPQIIIDFLCFLGVKKLDVVTNQVAYSDKKLRSYFTYKYGLEEGLAKTITNFRKNNQLK